MKIELILPQGYCAGVNNAINIALKARKEHETANVYVLGMLVHNEIVIDLLKKQNILSISPEELDKLHTGDVLIFTAHGHEEKYDKIAQEKGLIIYDATCPKVASNIKKIKKEIAAGHQVIYIGQSHHKETVAALSISENVSLYDTKLLINYYSITDKSPFIINQTTLNFLELNDIHKDIKEHIPGARFANEICNATRQRQEAILNISKDTNLIIIVGDKRSSNTTKLYDIAVSNFPNAKVLFVASVEYLKGLDLSGYKKAAISSGASTPQFVVDDIYNYLLSK